MDVGAGSQPARQFVLLISYRSNSREKPAKAAVGAPQRKLHLKRNFSSNTIVQPFQNLRQNVGVMQGLPSRAGHLLGGFSGVDVPAIVVPENLSVGVGDPCQLGHGVGQLTELFFRPTNCLFPSLEFGQMITYFVLFFSGPQGGLNRADQGYGAQRTFLKSDVAQRYSHAGELSAGAIGLAASRHHDDGQIGPGWLALQGRCDALYVRLPEGLFPDQRDRCAHLQFVDQAGYGGTNVAGHSPLREDCGNQLGVATAWGKDQNPRVVVIGRRHYCCLYCCLCRLLYAASKPTRQERRLVYL